MNIISLKKQLRNSEQKLVNLLAEENNIQKKISRLRASIEDLKSKIKRIEETANSKKEVRISDSALLKYLKEVKGLDLDSLKKEMVPESIKEKIIKNGNGVYEACSHKIESRSNQVVTVFVEDIEAEALENRRKELE